MYHRVFLVLMQWLLTHDFESGFFSEASCSPADYKIRDSQDGGFDRLLVITGDGGEDEGKV